MSPRPHILIVDDDREIRLLLSQYLEKNQFRTSAVPDGKAMWRLLDQSYVDLIVLDIMLPGDDGLTLCRQLRERSQVPVIMLTARGDDVDRILGFEIGADDYLPKPFNPRELLERIKAVLRRASQVPHDPDTNGTRGYRFGGWYLDVKTRTLIAADGTKTQLTGAEYRLLVLLLSRAGRVLSRMLLTQLIHGREHDPFDRSIDVRISRLRQVLNEEAREAQIIRTVYGEGYTIGVDVEAV